MINELINLHIMQGKELVDLYNRYSSNKVLRFSDRATAIKRCTQVLTEAALRQPEVVKRHSYPLSGILHSE